MKKPSTRLASTLAITMPVDWAMRLRTEGEDIRDIMPDLMGVERISCAAEGRRKVGGTHGGRLARHAAFTRSCSHGNRQRHFRQRIMGGEPARFSQKVRCDRRNSWLPHSGQTA